MTNCWVNGQPELQASVYDRGLQFGDGLFETLVFKNKQPLLLEEHLQRLEMGCSKLNIQVDTAQLSTELVYCLNQHELYDGIVKLIVTRGNSKRGYASPADATANRYIYISPYPIINIDHQQGIKLALCKTRLAKQPLLAGIKHLNRLEQILARQELSEEYPEGILCDTDGFVIEGCMSNIFILNDEKLITPLIDQCGVAGVMAGAIINKAKSLGLQVEQKRVTLEELQSGESIFLSNSVIGIWPVKMFMHKAYNVLPNVQKLQKLIQGYH